ncbi:MAG: hypothetical protein MUP97_14520, partial [Acidimicrobiia bacterium]|nr:hypothetical protein [Acidimicrobiia bacterium]
MAGLIAVLVLAGSVTIALPAFASGNGNQCDGPDTHGGPSNQPGHGPVPRLVARSAVRVGTVALVAVP